MGKSADRQVGIDIGGTCTDVVAIEQAGGETRVGTGLPYFWHTVTLLR